MKLYALVILGAAGWPEMLASLGPTSDGWLVASVDRLTRAIAPLAIQKDARMPYPREWLVIASPHGAPSHVTLLVEVEGTREAALPELANAVLDHYADLERLKRLGRKRLASLLRAKLPREIRIRSGDLGEIIASEWVEMETPFALPIKRLRWKDGREASMRGDDLIAVSHEAARLKILKGEAKSRARLEASVVEEALSQLDRDSGRPQAHTLAFIADRLDEMGRDDEALLIYDILAEGLRDNQLEHLIFTLSGNDPSGFLGRVGARRVPLQLVGVYIPDHRDFVMSVFAECDASLER